MGIRLVLKNNKRQYEGSYYYKDCNGKRQRAWHFATKKKNVEDWLIKDKLERRRNIGKPQVANPYRSLDEVIEFFFERREFKELARKTRQTYRSRIEGASGKSKANFRSWCAIKNITHVHQLKGRDGKDLAQEYYSYLKDILKNSAPNSYLNTVVDLFNVELKRRDTILESNPFAGQKRGKRKKKDIRYFDQAELEALEKVMTEYELAVFHFILHLGLRVDEYQTLTWAHVKGKKALDSSDPLRIEITEHYIERKEKDIDGVFRPKRVLWTPKTEDGERTLPLDLTAERALDYFRERTRGNKYVFNLDHDGPLSHNYVNKLCEKVMKRAVKLAPSLTKIGDRSKDVSAKTFRASFGSFSLQSGRNMENVAEMMGHAGTRTTREHYAKLSMENKIDSVVSLDNFLNKQNSSYQA